MPRLASVVPPVLLLLATVGAPALLAVEPGPLPAPDRSGGLPLMQALAERQSHREFADAPLTTQQLSDLLWATAGVNRADAGKRTAPTARNWQEVDVYLTTPEGVFLYQPAEHALARVDGRDLRALAGSQGFVATAPLNLVFVADTARMVNCPPERFDFYTGADTAFMAQNAYLYCASAGLRCVVRALIDRDAFHAALGLTASQRVTLAMTVGVAPAGE